MFDENNKVKYQFSIYYDVASNKLLLNEGCCSSTEKIRKDITTGT